MNALLRIEGERTLLVDPRQTVGSESAHGNDFDLVGFCVRAAGEAAPGEAGEILVRGATVMQVDPPGRPAPGVLLGITVLGGGVYYFGGAAVHDSRGR